MRAIVVFASVFALASSACSSQPAAPEPAEAPAGPVKQAEPEPPPTDDAVKRVDFTSVAPPKITLDKAGADPKERLRFMPKVGVEEAVVMTMNMTMKMSMAGQQLAPVTTPPMLVDARGTVESVEDGAMQITYAIDGMRVGKGEGTDAATAETLRSVLADVKGFEAKMTVNDRGVATAGYVNVPLGLPPHVQQLTEQVQQSLAQMQVPLPEESVGVGAQWTVVTQVEQGGMSIEQTARYEITKRDGTALGLSVKFSQKLVDDKFEPAAMPGVTGTIDRFQSGGSGEVSLALDQVTPQSLSTTNKLKMALSISTGGNQSKQDMEMDLGVKMVRK